MTREEAISRIKAVEGFAIRIAKDFDEHDYEAFDMAIKALEQEPIHGKCNQCKYYEGVHNVLGHAPCSYHKIGGVMWNWYCSQFESEVEE